MVQALADAKPDAIFNVLFGADLSKFVREGNTRGLFKGREVVSLLTGEPEYLDPLKDEAPNGWIVTGYPVVRHPDARAQGVLPRLPAASTTTTRGSARWSATSTIMSIAEGIKKAKSTDTEKLIAAFSGLEVMTPFGKITYRAHRPPVDDGRLSSASTKLEGGKGVMVDYRYLDGAKFLPTDDEVQEAARGTLIAPPQDPRDGRSPASSSSSSTGWPARRRCSSSAAGLSLIFGVTRIVNFAHGSFYMLGHLHRRTRWSQRLGGRGARLLAGAAASPRCAVGALGALIEMLLLRRIYRAPELLPAARDLRAGARDQGRGAVDLGARRTCSGRARRG